jgi:hypothetical protein
LSRRGKSSGECDKLRAGLLRKAGRSAEYKALSAYADEARVLGRIVT